MLIWFLVIFFSLIPVHSIVERDKNVLLLSEALRFIDSVQNSPCKGTEFSNQTQYSVVTIGIGGGFAAQVLNFFLFLFFIYSIHSFN